MASQPDDTDPAIADTAASASDQQLKLRAVGPGDKLKLGRYELGEEVGEGGMATVYRARDTELRRDVAIKVLFPHLAKRPEIVRRFHREARAAAALDHPNILKIFDVGGGDAGDPPFIVMELIRGRSLLAEIEQRGPMLAEIAAAIGALFADALAVAHRAAIVHRDVKPANVMIAHGGRLLLTDFGVARLETEDSLVTKTGAVLGTPAYMSPEQASGDTATARSDLYSLGTTIYQLATGSLPYGGAAARVLAQIASGSAAPAVRRRPAVGADLSRIVERLMAVDPSKRPIDAEGVAGELRALVAAGGLGEPRDELVRYFGDPDGFVRDKTPAVVSALVGAAQKALTEQRMPRAMALADRASALAPEDPAVTALVSAVTEGGRTSRKPVVIGGAVVLALAAGGGVYAMFRGGSPAVVHDDAAIAMVVADAPQPMPDAAAIVDAPVAIVEPRDAAAAPIDAAVVRVGRDAGVRLVAVSDAFTVDAVVAAVAPPDAPAVTIAPDAAPPAAGAIHVVNDTWCNVAIDGADRGRLASTPYRVDAGRHRVECAQNATRRWEQTVDVAPGQTAEARGAMLGNFEVTITTAVTIDGQAAAPGAVLKLHYGQHELVAGSYRQFFDVQQRCTLRKTTDETGNVRFDCFP